MGNRYLDYDDDFGGQTLLALAGRQNAKQALHPAVAAAMGLTRPMIPRMPMVHPAVAAAMQASQSDDLTRAEKIELARGDDVPFGIDSGAVATAVSAAISTQPQKRCVPRRLFLTETVAQNFAASNITVGVEPILITTGIISCAIFIQNATAPSFRAVVLEVGMTFNITVTNLTGATERFIATVMSKYVPSGL